ncbi:ABC transporter ATP-binding protein [Candidatus Falkowbacteria bacterium]|nr:ABC transporter ATP-binding protein [Candidatus Falkowbacteria bacterium]
MLEVKNLSKIYDNNGKATEVLKDLNFEISDKRFVVFVGPSGCGKTTLLKIIAGLLEPTNGEAILDKKVISEPNEERGMVFQNFTLFPWLTVKENINFGLKIRNIDEKEKNKIIEHYLRVTDLSNFADFYPKNLSGGMQQRVAIARTLANNPKILLMDEPFGSLDSQTRSAMQEFLTKLWESEQKTILFVTHDVEEAIFLADKVILLMTRPAKIKKEYDVNFPRPRLHNLKFSEEFFKLEREVTKDLES